MFLLSTLVVAVSTLFLLKDNLVVVLATSHRWCGVSLLRNAHSHKASSHKASRCNLQTEDLLVKRRDLLEKKIAQELQRAKELSAAKNKRGELVFVATPCPSTDRLQQRLSLTLSAGALAALKKKKLYETQLEAAENNIQRINEQQGMLEEQRAQVVQLAAMRNAAQASKATMQVSFKSICQTFESIAARAEVAH